MWPTATLKRGHFPVTASPSILSAAEASGDRIAAGILAHLARREPQLRWTGCWGSAMAADCQAPFDPLGDVSDLSASGAVELIPHLPALLRARMRLQAALDRQPDLAVFVDAPDFHLPLAARARRQGIPTVLVVPPQWWAWRPRRLQTMGAHADLVLCLFRFEVEPLRAQGVAAHWIGHPAAVLLEPQVELRSPTPDETLKVAILPGSRPAEVRRYLRPFLAGLQLALGSTGRRAEVTVPWRLASAPPKVEGVSFRRSEGAVVLAQADLALVAAGTATLEAAAVGVPTVIAAAANPVTAAIARRLLRKRRLGLPNILLNDDVIPELQQDLHPQRLAAALAPLLDDPNGARRQAALVRQRLRPYLGKPGFGARAADCISGLLQAAPGWD